MSVSKRILETASDLDKYQEYQSPRLDAIERAAEEIGKSWSGSWIGYQSRVYYAEFQPPPPGAHFSKQWGGRRDPLSDEGTRGEWREYNPRVVEGIIYKVARIPSFDTLSEYTEKARSLFDEVKQAVLSIVYANFDLERDAFLSRQVSVIESLKISKENHFILQNMPTTNIVCMDWRALDEGICTPPHMAVLAKVFAARSPIENCRSLRLNVVNLAKYLQNVERSEIMERDEDKNVFIGHGRSLIWLELKNFIGQRLGLPCDEFDRVPPAGQATTARLAQMLDQAAFAFLVMTAEDEDAHGKVHARLNVIHEAGLFQGRLGFEKAIIVLEEGCQEFSNIHGLGQIRFPHGNISAAFEDVRRVLEREKLIKSTAC